MELSALLPVSAAAWPRQELQLRLGAAGSGCAAALGLAFGYKVPGLSKPLISRLWCPKSGEAAAVDERAGML